MTYEEFEPNIKIGVPFVIEGSIFSHGDKLTIEVTRVTPDFHVSRILDKIPPSLAYFTGWYPEVIIDNPSELVVDWFDDAIETRQHSCRCDFYSVILIKGCQCGGL